jgi:hypothetical protein
MKTVPLIAALACSLIGPESQDVSIPAGGLRIRPDDLIVRSLGQEQLNVSAPETLRILVDVRTTYSEDLSGSKGEWEHDPEMVELFEGLEAEYQALVETVTEHAREALRAGEIEPVKSAESLGDELLLIEVRQRENAAYVRLAFQRRVLYENPDSPGEYRSVWATTLDHGALFEIRGTEQLITYVDQIVAWFASQYRFDNGR